MSEEKITLQLVEKEGKFVALPPAVLTFMDKPQTDTAPKPTQGSFEENQINIEDWARWGADDNLPTIMRKKIKTSPIAGQVVLKKVQMMYGNGLCYYDNEAFEKTGQMKRVIRPKIERFLRINRIHTHYLPAQFTDWNILLNSFNELIFSRDGKRVTNIYHKPAIYSRLEVQNQDTFKIDHLYYSPQFAEDYPENDDIKRIPLFDWTEQEEWLSKFKGQKFAWHCKWPGQDPYYAEAFWVGLAIENGWLDANAKIPITVNKMMDNQITLKYLIHIPVSYYKLRHNGFDQLDEKKKEEIIKKHIDKINGMLKGIDKTFSSIASLFEDDNIGVSGNQGSGKIEIVAVDDKLKRDSWVPTADHSNAQIIQGLGMHPSQMGLAPEGGKMGAGSGSDQRESFNTGVQLNTIEQDIILEPLNWLAIYNAQVEDDWNVTFFMDHTTHTTTNQVETGLVPGQNAPGQNAIR